MAAGQPANHERINDVTIARLINKVHCGPVITAMEVDQIDETWLDVFLGITVDLPRKQARADLIKRKFEEFERKHPTYGKYVS